MATETSETTELSHCPHCEHPVAMDAGGCPRCPWRRPGGDGRAMVIGGSIGVGLAWVLALGVWLLLAGCGDSPTEPGLSFPVAFEATSPAQGTAYTSLTCQGEPMSVEFVRATLFLDEPDADGLGVSAGLVVDRLVCSSEILSTWSVGGEYELAGDSIRFRSGSLADAEWAGPERVRFTTDVRLRGELVAMTFEREG